MNIHRKTVATAVMVSLGLIPMAYSQTKEKTKEKTTQSTTTTTQVSSDFSAPRHVHISSDLLGKPVMSDGKRIGELEDFVVDVNSGRVIYGVSSFDTIQGASGKLYPVPYTSVRYSGDAQTYITKMTPDRIVTATSFPENQWPDFSDQYITTTYRHYNETPWWDGTKTVTTTKTGDDDDDDSKARLVSYKERWTSRPTTVRRVSEIRGREIVAADGSKVGLISDVVMDPESGRILYAIEGSGASRHAIPWVALSPSTGNTYQVKITADRIKRAPVFEETRITDRGWAEEVHRYYSVEPYWSVSTTTRETRP